LVAITTSSRCAKSRIARPRISPLLPSEYRFAVSKKLMPPSGQPVLVQAGSSPQGRDFAARVAEIVFSIQTRFEDAVAYYADIKTARGSMGAILGSSPFCRVCRW
jgi:alkanesulfonate monooxygenase SsuD/methylene tetrahydromethanopterin reductase-like flavin-dependent oxidoreductase (luciferase family)